MRNKEMIEEIKNISIASKKSNGKTLYLINKDKNIPIILKFIEDKFCEYIDYTRSSFLWNVDDIESFYQKYIKHINDYLEFKEISRRSYGEPKLIKPLELKNSKPICSIVYEGRKNQIFTKNTDIWIKHNDYFSKCISQEEATEKGIEFNVRERFIYKNNFSPVILRGEGWLCIKNLLLYIHDNNILPRLATVICNFYGWTLNDYSGVDELFYNNLIYKLKVLYSK